MGKKLPKNIIQLKFLKEKNMKNQKKHTLKVLTLYENKHQPSQKKRNLNFKG